MADAVLAINAGSSSIKFALFEFGPRPMRIAHGAASDISSNPRLKAFGRDESVLADQPLPGGHDDIVEQVVGWSESHLEGDRLVAAGHRIVHGGDRYRGPALLTEPVLRELDSFSAFAPLHQPHNLKAVRTLMQLRPDLPQVGCFDTAFHQGMTAVVRRYGLPRALEARGLHKYGFHGLSYDYVAGRLREIAPDRASGRIVIAHLGSGASLCALKDGRSIDTSMGFSALDGLVMAKRCGALDPGLLLYLVRDGLDAAALEGLLYNRSGLLGVSGISGDMRTLLASTEPAAQDAVELFVFRAAREIAALCATLQGLDGIVFTAGIGENAPEIRHRIADRLAWLGLRLDTAANAAGRGLISTPDSPVSAWVIPTDEEQVIARQTSSLLFGPVEA